MASLRDSIGNLIYRSSADSTTIPRWMVSVGIFGVAFLIVRLAVGLVSGETPAPAEVTQIPVVAPGIGSSAEGGEGGSIFEAWEEGGGTSPSTQPGPESSTPPEADLSTPEGTAAAVAVAYYTKNWADIPTSVPADELPAYNSTFTTVEVTDVVEVVSGDSTREYDVWLLVDGLTQSFRVKLEKGDNNQWAYAGVG